MITNKHVMVSERRLKLSRDVISNNVLCGTSKVSDQPAHTRSLIRTFAGRLKIIQVLSYCLNSIRSF